MPAAPTVFFFFIFSYLFPKFAYISFLYDVIYQKIFKKRRKGRLSLFLSLTLYDI